MLAALATLEASCFCGAVKLAVDVAKPPLAVSICHCRTCRQLTGAPMLANLVLPSDAVKFEHEENALTSLKTSKHVTRHRCASCASPIYATLGKGRAVVPLALFSRLPEGWEPQHHMYYDRRVLDVADDLPKYRRNFGGVLWQGEPPEEIEAATSDTPGEPPPRPRTSSPLDS